jgi:EpsI family protein
MCCASALAVVATPRTKIADSGPRVDLERLFPTRFGDWRIDTSLPVVLPSPDAQAVINRIYNQTLARTYVNARGDRVMLSVAYGGDQSDNMAVHKPEVCYPGQGFEVLAFHKDGLKLAGRTVPVRRLLTRLNTRVEPVTYWITVGNKVAGTGFSEKLAQLSYGMTGVIPDGMLVRVSTIDRDEARAYQVQSAFLVELTDSMAPESRSRVLGSLAM